MREQVLDISWGTIFKLAAAGLVVYVFFLVRDLLILLLFAIIISILFEPVIDFLRKRRIPRVVAAISVYMFVFGLVALVLFGTAPLFIHEIQRFTQAFPGYFETLAPVLGGLGVAAFADLPEFTEALIGDVERLSKNILTALFAIFGGIFATVFVVSLAIFLSIEEKAMERTIGILFPRRYEALALDLWAKSQRKVSGWFLSRLLSSLFVAGATYFALILFDVQYPVSLSLIAGLTNFVPIIGPLLAGLLIAMLVAVDSTLKAIFVVLAFVLIQQIESSILTPMLSKRFIGLPPALVLIALAIGGQLWGIVGAILAIPLFGILFEFLRDFLKKKKEETPVVL
ncbi:MAG: AI-2E family transporter [Candidatus Yanofskybacteria bacterium]|nr:AI-2E family transporter [Candidatus Yanofskybacteria bacterium]